MDQFTLYLAAHALLAAGIVGSGAWRLATRRGGLAEWGNDCLYVGLVFIIGLTTVMTALRMAAG